MARKVAVVEDEEALASLIEYNLTHNGFQVQLVNGSGPTMQDLETGQPDLILLDVMLPALDGFEVCRLIRKSEKLSDACTIESRPPGRFNRWPQLRVCPGRPLRCASKKWWGKRRWNT